MSGYYGLHAITLPEIWQERRERMYEMEDQLLRMEREHAVDDSTGRDQDIDDDQDGKETPANGSGHTP